MNASRKKGLGRGLSALFGDSTPEEKTKNINQSTMVAIADLTRNLIRARCLVICRIASVLAFGNQGNQSFYSKS